MQEIKMATTIDTEIKNLEELFANESRHSFYNKNLLSSYCYNGNLEAIKTYGTPDNLDKRVLNGWTYLCIACCGEENLTLIQHLIEKGATPSLQTKHGWTPLHIVAFFGHEEIIRYLVEDQEVNVTVKDQEGRTAYGIALLKGCSDEILNLLEENPAEENHSICAGCTLF
jgi:ankyrin repeat protein